MDLTHWLRMFQFSALVPCHAQRNFWHYESMSQSSFMLQSACESILVTQLAVSKNRVATCAQGRKLPVVTPGHSEHLQEGQMPGGVRGGDQVV